MTPLDMVDTISTGSESTQSIRSVCLARRLPSPYIEAFFTIRSAFAIIKFHVFRMDDKEPDVVFAKVVFFAEEENSLISFLLGYVMVL